MKLSDLKPGQKVSINGMLAEYKGIQKVRISNFGKVEKEFSKLMGLIFTNITILLKVQKRLKAKKLN